MQHEYNNDRIPSLGVQMALVVLMAVFCEMANGANFSLVPHVNASYIGVMAGFVGGMGNLGMLTRFMILLVSLARVDANSHLAVFR